MGQDGNRDGKSIFDAIQGNGFGEYSENELGRLDRYLTQSPATQPSENQHSSAKFLYHHFVFALLLALLFSYWIGLPF